MNQTSLVVGFCVFLVVISVVRVKSEVEVIVDDDVLLRWAIEGQMDAYFEKLGWSSEDIVGFVEYMMIDEGVKYVPSTLEEQNF